MKAPNESSIEAYLARLAERLGFSADRVEALHAKYEGWQHRFREHPLFRELHDKVVEAWQFLRNPHVPTKDKAVVLAAIAYVLMPFDLIPDYLPVIGLLDDLAAMTLALTIVQRHRGGDTGQEAAQPDADGDQGDGVDEQPERNAV